MGGIIIFSLIGILVIAICIYCIVMRKIDTNGVAVIGDDGSSEWRTAIVNEFISCVGITFRCQGSDDVTTKVVNDELRDATVLTIIYHQFLVKAVFNWQQETGSYTINAFKGNGRAISRKKLFFFFGGCINLKKIGNFILKFYDSYCEKRYKSLTTMFEQFVSKSQEEVSGAEFCDALIDMYYLKKNSDMTRIYCLLLKYAATHYMLEFVQEISSRDAKIRKELLEIVTQLSHEFADDTKNKL